MSYSPVSATGGRWGHRQFNDVSLMKSHFHSRLTPLTLHTPFYFEKSCKKSTMLDISHRCIYRRYTEKHIDVFFFSLSKWWDSI